MIAKYALVTGASGFLGRHCCLELFNQGYEVTGLDLSPFVDYHQWGVNSFISGSCDLKELNKVYSHQPLPEIIIHCAGSGSVQASYENPHQDFYSNVVTSMEILEFCRINPSICISVPSSAAVYGNTDCLPIPEKLLLNPISPYGLHKKIIEELVTSYVKNFKVKASVVRFFFTLRYRFKKTNFLGCLCKS